MLEIYAGESARKTIEQNGFSADLFTSFLGASGGPKWFTLFGLDKYLFGEFFNGRTAPLNIVGSSAGAFRSACFAQKDPVAATKRFAKHYSETTYSEKPDASEITQSVIDILDDLFGETGIDEIINNDIFRAHFLVAKCQGLVASEHKVKQIAGLSKSFVNNALDRKRLTKQYQRYVFSQASSDLQLVDEDGFTTINKALNHNNIKQALIASGAIPLVMKGIKDIPECEPGMYRDGGIIDYHFDFAIQNQGLTLYPHFSSTLKAGWFDKNLKRKVRSKHYDNTVVICPSAKYVATLPYQKISDRSDFVEMETQQRLNYWQDILAASEYLAEDFDQFVEQQALNKIKPMQALLG
ncbi:patatin-like phospholipase family protein [Thalassotalea sp. LPB0316]|uniref:patatin-like phospholipase family protein n=1 Tax=Thalassotalea sp. LPB0316 TaxID=2769490 RepID=UPI00186692F1|nr:patatin-like phospholipase family protein [Thalassotalea sp. LPB0316]QOL25815.1 patatin-like phospholipase family protein [Thalassotalea sp. LPB0316]